MDDRVLHRVAQAGFTRVRPLLVIALLILGAWSMVSSPAEAARARIGDMNVTLKGEQLRIRSAYHGAFTKHVNNAMLAGIPIVVTIQVKIDFKGKKRKRAHLNDTFEHRIQYDTIASQYTLEVRRGLETKTIFETVFTQVREIASTIDYSVKLPEEMIDPDPEYEVKLKATLDSQRENFALQFILFLLRNPIDTPWRILIFKPAIEQLGNLEGDN